MNVVEAVADAELIVGAELMVEFGEEDGKPYIVTQPLVNYRGVRDWIVSASKQPAPSAPPPVPAPPPASPRPRPRRPRGTGPSPRALPDLNNVKVNGRLPQIGVI